MPGKGTIDAVFILRSLQVGVLRKGEKVVYVLRGFGEGISQGPNGTEVMVRAVEFV